MASLKDFLRTFLTSFRGSHKSVPAGNWIVIERTINSGAGYIDSNVYTCPYDGTLTIQPEAPAFALVIRKNGMDWFTGGNGTGPWYSAWVQCKAGEAVNWSVESSNLTTACHLRFYPYVGEQ